MTDLSTAREQIAQDYLSRELHLLSELVLCGLQDKSNAEDALLFPISQISLSGLGLNSKSDLFHGEVLIVFGFRDRSF
jgi:hypothetical protein